MVLSTSPGRLERGERPRPAAGAGQVSIEVSACGVCRTDVHIVDGELAEPQLPLIPGHQIVGTVTGIDIGVDAVEIGQLVGVPWLGWTCGECRYCRMDAENLCERARFTGYTVDGGFADVAVAHQRYCFPLPRESQPTRVAPLLCAGLIGYRALRLAGDPGRLGLYGFGAAAHLIAQVAIAEGREVYAFVRPGDDDAAGFALELGAVWSGPSDQPGPEELDAALIFAPVGALVPAALAAVRRAGVVVCAGIHMSEIPAFSYDLLWEERVVRSVANLTRRDGEEFLALAARLDIQTQTTSYALERANEAIDAIRDGSLTGAAVLEIGGAS